MRHDLCGALAAAKTERQHELVWEGWEPEADFATWGRGDAVSSCVLFLKASNSRLGG